MRNNQSAHQTNTSVSTKTYMTNTKNSSSKQCKVAGCKQNHSQHFCKHCKDFDSDHFATDCQKCTTKPDSDEQRMNCKVPKCTENHKAHYCRVCSQNDIDHFARNCPKGLVMYHGTKLQYAKKILEVGFIPSAYGRVGGGIYFTDNFEVAAKIGQRDKHKAGNNDQYAVIECKFQENSEHVVKTQHPAWTKQNISTEPFWEYVIQKNYLKNLRIVEIHDLSF